MGLKLGAFEACTEYGHFKDVPSDHSVGSSTVLEWEKEVDDKLRWLEFAGCCVVRCEVIVRGRIAAVACAAGPCDWVSE
jgi:hypothetical protein